MDLFPVTESLVNNQKVGVKDKFAENLGFIIRDTGLCQIIQLAYKILGFLSSLTQK